VVVTHYVMDLIKLNLNYSKLSCNNIPLGLMRFRQRTAKSNKIRLLRLDCRKLTRRLGRPTMYV